MVLANIAQKLITPQWLLGGTSGPMLVLVMLAGLIACLLGYVLFRLELVGLGLYWGTTLGALLVDWRFAAPRGSDYFVVCTAVALLLAVAGWFLWRGFFAAATWASMAGAVGLMLMRLSGESSAVWPWLVGVLVGLGPAILAFYYTQTIFVFLSAALGALAAAASAALAITGEPIVRFASQGESQWSWALAGWMLLVAALAVAGIFTQNRLVGVLRTTFAPEVKIRKRARGRSRRSRKANIAPRFTKV